MVLLFSKPEIPRKLIRPKLPSGTAPGVNRAKLDQRRPLIGSSLIEVWLMLVEKSCCVVLITGASALTSTDPVTGPTESDTSNGVSRPISTITFSLTIGLKPDELTVTEYLPGCKLATLKRPVSSVVAVSSLFVSRFLTATEAPDTTSLFGLVTTPPIAPVVVDCANATAQRASTSRPAKENFMIFDILGNSLGNELTFQGASAHRAALMFSRVCWFLNQVQKEWNIAIQARRSFYHACLAFRKSKS